MSGPALKKIPFEQPSRGAALSILCAANPARIKQVAEELLPLLGRIEIVSNRTGLVMMPYRDTARGSTFFLGEVLMAQAHLRSLDHDVEGYAMIVGHDLEQAMAAAVLDAVGAAQLSPTSFDAFVSEAREEQRNTDEALRRDIEATRVQMETF